MSERQDSHKDEWHHVITRDYRGLKMYDKLNKQRGCPMKLDYCGSNRAVFIIGGGASYDTLFLSTLRNGILINTCDVGIR